ncbi:hypothetical protein KO498_17290 [Lentibacter algarum]|uniref:hypothetical protein n=1 Tax=Lentibacter algarum TaxID=576131 RepID=UPI001C0A4BB0|nr:hypothetical protein [Lentibacter algarum]MBU2983565.1 hypothetical protein [Lentibacter algarum]
MEILKDAFDALSQRVRSPFFGSILFAFFAINWKPIWYLLFADQPVQAKFDFFDKSTDFGSLYAFPLLAGVLLALAWPWLRLLGAWVAIKPTMQLRNMQSDSAIDHRIHRLGKLADEERAKAKLAAETENAKIDAAKRLKEAQTVSTETATEIVGEREEKELAEESDLDFGQLEDYSFAIEILASAAKSDNGAVRIQNNTIEKYSSLNGWGKAVQLESHRETLEAQATMSFLKGVGLVGSNSGGGFAITSLGYEALEYFSE